MARQRNTEEAYTIRVPDPCSDFMACTRDVTVEVSEDGRQVSLAKTVLLLDETGRGSPLTTGGEEITRFVWAKKEFLVEDTRLEWARLLFYVYEYPENSSPLLVEVNGHVLSVEPGYGSQSDQFLWRLLDLPVHFLCEGANTFIFRSESAAFNSWILGVDGSTITGRSAKSTTGGRSWRRALMGYADALGGGEYLVRLQLGRYASSGTITSPVIDLAETSTGISHNCRLGALKVHYRGETPAGTRVILRYRTGKRPSGSGEWSPWLVVSDDSCIDCVDRYFQWQATLSTDFPLATPKILEICTEVQRKPVQDLPAMMKVEARDIGGSRRSSFSFSYQRSDDPKLALLRQQEGLDAVVGGAGSEFEQYLRLREWVGQQWAYHGGRPYPPWDALVILDWLRGTRPDAHGGCMHYAVVFCQCCLSLGLTARLVLVEPFPNLMGDGHFATEVWSNDYCKWVYMDPTTNSHFEHSGIPSNMLEIRQLWEEGRTDELRQVSGRARAHAVLGPTYPLDHVQRGGFRHAGLVLRNDQLSSLSPGPLEHGPTAYRWTGFLWWGRHVPHEQPQFPLCSDRWEDFYWPLNQVNIHLQHTDELNCLNVILDSETPNLDRYEVSLDDARWKRAGSSFTWILKTGQNTLRARVRNKLGLVGPLSQIVVRSEPD